MTIPYKGAYNLINRETLTRGFTSMKSITHIQTRTHLSFAVFFDNGKQEIIHPSTQPRRGAAVLRLIKRMNKCKIGINRDVLFEYTPAIKIVTLAESFADAAVKAVRRMTPADVSMYESGAAEAESWVYNNQFAPDFCAGQLRRAVTFRWYARTLMSGKVDRAALVKALEGYEL